MSALDQLSELVGLSRAYHDIYGAERVTTSETQRALLAAMGFAVDDTAALEAAVVALRERPWRELTAPVSVQRTGDRLHVLITASRSARVKWRLVCEDGAVHAAEAVDLQVVDERDGRARLRLDLPEVAIGYHDLFVEAGEQSAQHRLIVAPRACHVPPVLNAGGRGWGTAVQIYALRTQTSWGIGDYGDLAELARVMGSAGASFVGVSPLHASFPHRPGDASPYSPSSRLFLNWIYIDVESVPDYTASSAARELVASPEVQAELAAVRGAELIDYAAVGKLKRRVLELAYRCFRENHLESGDGRAQSFRAFVDAGGERLRQHVTYEALQDHLFARDAGAWGWPVWPAQYREPDAPAVTTFANDHRERVEFFAYLQWIADAQLARAAATAKGAGMRIGLYIDLAVGVDRAGSETWASSDVYATAASVGAPPDELALKGQNWGLPPLIPERLRDSAYAPLVATLRQCMKHAGALRMDHVMALLRLFWVPPGRDATDGAYVYYPFRDLLGILALESIRNQCLVIGEDLGTVPDEVRSALAEHQVLSYRVFYFEQEHDYRPKPPEHYPRCALVTASTHDLPTLKGFWERRDLALRAELDLYPSVDMRGRQEHGRTVQKQRILGALAERQLATYDEASFNAPLTQEMVRAVYTYLARTPSWLLAVQLEDVLGVLEQANLPGTVHEHPNWRRRLPISVAEIGASPGFALLAEALRREGR